MADDNKMVALTLDPKMIEGIVRQQIQAAIILQLNAAPQMIEAVAAVCVNKKVNERGEVSTYSHDNRYPLVEILCQNAIKETAEAALRQWVAENKATILAAIRKHMNAHKADMVKKFVAAAEKSIDPNFSVSCSMKMDRD